MRKSRGYASIQQHIDAEDFYDAYAAVQSVQSRAVAAGNVEDAVTLCREYAVKFIDAEQYDLGADTSLLMMKTYKDCKLEPTSERLSCVTGLLDKLPPKSTKQKRLLIEAAVTWTQTEAEPKGSMVLHQVAAKAYQAEGDYGRAQAHIVYSGGAEAIHSLIVEWQKSCYMSEADLLVLRLVLILLCLERVTTASELIDKIRREKDGEGVTLSPPLQLTFLITECCKALNFGLFEMAKAKYTLVLRRDGGTFNKLLDNIEVTVFKRQRSEAPGGLLSLISNLMN